MPSNRVAVPNNMGDAEQARQFAIQVKKAIDAALPAGNDTLLSQPQRPPSQTIPTGRTVLVSGPLTLGAGVTITIQGTGLLRII